MNYGKSAYLKVSDLERSLNFSSDNMDNNKCLELSKLNLNQSFSNQVPFVTSFEPFEVKEGSNLCFQIKITLENISGGQTNFKLLLNNCEVYSEKKTLSSGQTDVFILKTYTPSSSETLTLGLNISSSSDPFSALVTNISVVVLGTGEGSSNTAELELRAIKTSNTMMLVSFINENKLFYSFTPLTANTLSEFTYAFDAISHIYLKESFESSDIVLYKVDSSGNLIYSKPFLGTSEQIIDTHVQKVFACECPVSSEKLHIVFYIKDGQCYFKEATMSGHTNAKKVILPPGEYYDIHACSHSGSEHIYILASHKNGSNYLVKSLASVQTNKFTESLDIDYAFNVSKYIDLDFSKPLLKEKLNMTAIFVTNKYSIIDEILNNNLKENLKLNCTLTVNVSTQ